MAYSRETIVVCGAGVAGQTFAKHLRAKFPSLSIKLLSAESCLPYNRTRLSKHLCLPSADRDLGFVSAEELADFGIEYLQSSRVVTVDCSERRLSLDSGAQLSWDHLILATGARPRPGNAAAGELTFYNMEDFEKLDAMLEAAGAAATTAAIRPALIRGSGILAVELADQIRRRGFSVWIQTSGRRLMSRELPADLGAQVKALAEGAGVKILDIAEGTGFCLRIAALGTEPLSAPGVSATAGVPVNWAFHTEAADVYAIGDCAVLPDGTVSHLWHMAEEQAEQLAENFGSTTWKYSPNIFRAKAEVFGKLVFSGGTGGDPAQALAFESPDLSLRAEFSDNKLTGIRYIGKPDKAFGKDMLGELRNGAPREKLQKMLGLLH